MRILCAALAILISSSLTRPQTANSQALVGTWVLFPISDPATRPPLGEVKVFTESTWTITRTDVRNGFVLFHHGGTYIFDGTNYSETVTFANTANLSLIGQTFQFVMKIDEPAFSQTGTGNSSRFTVGYRRLTGRDAASQIPAAVLACEASPEGRSALLNATRLSAATPPRELPTIPPAIADYMKVSFEKLAVSVAARPDVLNLLDLARCHYAQRRLREASAELGRAVEAIRQAMKSTAPALVKLKDVPPVYPPEAANVQVSGVVVVDATIGADGRVQDAQVARSVPLLDAAAVAAVRQWEFAPPPEAKTAPLVVTFGTPTPRDGLDAARFLYVKGQFADAERAASDALALLGKESQQLTPGK
jgi:TonB family protein